MLGFEYHPGQDGNLCKKIQSSVLF